MKQAIASENDIDTLRKIMMVIEQYVETGVVEDDDGKVMADCEIMVRIGDIFNQDGHGWRRVVEGYQVMFANACDPELPHLELKPELKRMTEVYPIVLKALVKVAEFANACADKLPETSLKAMGEEAFGLVEEAITKATEDE